MTYNTTFSMVARCSKTFSLGVCVSTASPAVGSRVPHVTAGVGAIATQAKTNINYGLEGLSLLRQGFLPRVALERLMKKDWERETRQVIIIDQDGRTAAFTGRETIDWKGHLVGEDYVVAGNMLTGSRVIKAMAESFESSAGEELPERLMKVLEAGQSAGGDKRGKVSAALLAARETRNEKHTILDLRVDRHRDPVAELRRMLDTYYNQK